MPGFGLAKVWDWLGGDNMLIRGSKSRVRVIFTGKKVHKSHLLLM